MKFNLRLYYTGGSAQSESARQELSKLKDLFPNIEFEIEEIDLVLNPSLAEEEGIFATPTLIKFSPPPFEKWVGDLANLKKLLGLKS